MKHTKAQSENAKNKLMSLYDYKNIDFYEENEIWYLNCKDNVGESAFDVCEELIQGKSIRI